MLMLFKRKLFENIDVVVNKWLVVKDNGKEMNG